MKRHGSESIELDLKMYVTFSDDLSLLFICYHLRNCHRCCDERQKENVCWNAEVGGGWQKRKCVINEK